MRPLPSLSAFTEALTLADQSPQKLVFDEKGTICAPGGAKSVAPPPLLVLTGQGAGAEILVKGELSHGGMGQVFLAEQTSLGREVAVKAANAAEREAELVVEARVAGALEHPNIVPVHVLGQNAEGKPLIVMKRIEGESWKDLLAQGPNLARDVDILMDVCRALHFAHAHGVVHRDVKPANVMVGRFGEVYLLDWGVAVGFGDGAPPDVPHTSTTRGMSGTPHYMAPEMTVPGAPVDQRTDVYLAGAVLHELLTGTPPHAREDVERTLYAAHLADEPQLDGVPEEIAHICKTALKRDPAERYRSAEELRLALARFQSHGASRALCEDAERSLADLRNLPADADVRDVQRAFAACRFGFEHALRIWPESARARRGVAEAIEHMAWREIAAEHYDSAQLLVGELDAPSAQLAKALEELREKRARDAKNVEELQRFAHEHDRRIAERERALFVFGCGLGWLVLLLALAWLDRRDIFHAAGGTFALVMAAITLGIGVSALLLPAVRKNAASRSLVGAIVVGAVAITAVHVLGYCFEVPTAPILALGDTMLAATMATVAMQDERQWPPTVVAASIAPAIVLFPAEAYVVSGVGSFAALAYAAWMWRRAS